MASTPVVDPMTGLPPEDAPALDPAAASSKPDAEMPDASLGLDGAAEIGNGIKDAAGMSSSGNGKRAAAIVVDVGEENKRKRGRRNQSAEVAMADAEAVKKAVTTAITSRIRNKKKGWGEFSWEYATTRPVILDERTVGGESKKMTGVEYIIWKFTKTHRQSFKSFTLTEEQWQQVYNELQKDKLATAEAHKSDIRDSVAEVLGAETVSESCEIGVKFCWRHSEALETQMDNAGPGLGLMLPSQDDTLSSQSQVDVSDLTPRTRAMFENASTAMQDVAEAAPAGLGSEHVPFSELCKPLTELECGDFDLKQGLLGTFAKMPAESNTEGIKSLAAVVKAGTARFGEKRQCYGKLIPKACRKMLAARAGHLSLSLGDFVARLSDQLKIVAPKALECATFVASLIQGTKLVMNNDEAARAQSLMSASELPTLFSKWKSAITKQAKQHERTIGQDGKVQFSALFRLASRVLKKLIGEKGAITTDADTVADVSKELGALLQAARGAAEEGLGNFYAELVPAAIKAGAKLSSTWFRDVFLLKKKDADPMPEKLMGVEVFRDLAHARKDAKTALQQVMPDDASIFCLRKRLMKLKVHQLAADVSAIVEECDELDGKMLKILEAQSDPFTIPKDKWKYGGRYDVAAKHMENFFTSNFAARQQILQKAESGDTDLKVVADFGHRVAAKHSVTKKTLPLIVKAFLQLLDAQEKGTTDAGLASAEEFIKKIKHGAIFLKEDQEMKYKSGVMKFTTLQERHASSKTRQKAIQKGVLKAVKGKTG
eukprot:g19131.t1